MDFQRSEIFRWEQNVLAFHSPEPSSENVSPEPNVLRTNPLASRYLDFTDISGLSWSAIDEEIVSSPQAAQLASDQEELVSFLSQFFSTSVVQSVNKSLDDLEESFLTLKYTFRFPLNTLALAVLRDVMDEFMEPPNASGEGNPIESNYGAPFRSVRRVNVRLGEFTTLPKGSTRRGPSIKERGRMFQRSVPGSERVYNPFRVETGNVFLYHGTRSLSIPGFQRDGIFPKRHNTEFSMGCAFYVTNSTRSAFEHPVHNHLSQRGAVSVFQFEIDISVLQGMTAFSGSEVFRVLSFDRGNQDWREFVLGNIFHKNRDQHEFDVVIGPMCVPGGRPGIDMIELQIEGPTPLVQIALCTRRAMDWLSKSIVCIFDEIRD